MDSELRYPTLMEIIFPTGEKVQVPENHPVLETCITLQLTVAEDSTQLHLPDTCTVTAQQFKEYLRLERLYQIFHPESGVSDDEEVKDPRDDGEFVYTDAQKYWAQLYQQVKDRTITIIVAMKTAMLMSDEPTVEKCLDTLYYITELYYSECGYLGSDARSDRYSYFLVGAIIREFLDYEPIIKSVLPRLCPEFVVYITRNVYCSEGEELSPALLYNYTAFESPQNPPRFDGDTLLGIDPEVLLKDSITNAARTGKLSKLDTLYANIMESDANMTVEQMGELLELEDTLDEHTQLWHMIKIAGHCTNDVLSKFFLMMGAPHDGPSAGEWCSQYPNVAKIRFTSKLAQSREISRKHLHYLQSVFPHIIERLDSEYISGGKWEPPLLREMHEFFVREGYPQIAKKFYSPIPEPPAPVADPHRPALPHVVMNIPEVPMGVALAHAWPGEHVPPALAQAWAEAMEQDPLDQEQLDQGHGIPMVPMGLALAQAWPGLHVPPALAQAWADAMEQEFN